MNDEAVRATSCLEKDVESIFAFFDSNQNLWHFFRAASGFEHVHKKFTRRMKAQVKYIKFRKPTKIFKGEWQVEKGKKI